MGSYFGNALTTFKIANRFGQNLHNNCYVDYVIKQNKK